MNARAFMLCILAFANVLGNRCLSFLEKSGLEDMKNDPFRDIGGKFKDMKISPCRFS